MGVVQLAVVPPPEPVQVHAKLLPDGRTVLAVPGLHRLVVGVPTPLGAPQVPLKTGSNAAVTVQSAVMVKLSALVPGAVGLLPQPLMLRVR